MNKDFENFRKDALKVKEQIAQSCRLSEKGCLILAVYAGSVAYGRNTPESDVDIRGIYLPDPDDILLSQKSAALRARDQDTLLQPLHAFVHMAGQGNPNVLEWLFVRKEHILYADRYGSRLLEHRTLFLSKTMIRSYLGFASSSWKRLNDLIRAETPVQNPDIIRTLEKHASHLHRLLVQLREVLETGTMNVWNPNRIPALAIQDKHFVILSSFTEALKEESDRIRRASLKTALPEQCDSRKIRQLELSILKDWMCTSLSCDCSEADKNR